MKSSDFGILLLFLLELENYYYVKDHLHNAGWTG